MSRNLEEGSQLLVTAVHLDDTGCYEEAYEAYREGLSIYMEYLKSNELPLNKKEILRGRIQKLLARAEDAKIKVEQAKAALNKNEQTNNNQSAGGAPQKKTKLNKIPSHSEPSTSSDTSAENTLGNYKSISHEEITIEDNAIGYSYETIFSKCFQPEVQLVRVEEPYVKADHQFTNFLRFCELLVKKCKRLKKIILCTTPQQQQHQQQFFETLQESLLVLNVELEIRVSTTLHDRRICFDNGWIVKIGRGLNYFKSRKKHTIGSTDLDLAPCHQCTVDIFFTQGYMDELYFEES